MEHRFCVPLDFDLNLLAFGSRAYNFPDSYLTARDNH